MGYSFGASQQMDLYILRHGEAGKRVPNEKIDAERTLTGAGKKEVAEIARSLKRLKIKFDLIATSPLKRAYETAVTARSVLNVGKNALEVWNELQPQGNKIELYRKLSKLDHNYSILLVGHEPYLSGLVGEIISGDGLGDKSIDIRLKKAGLAKVVVSSFSTSRARGDLRWLL